MLYCYCDNFFCVYNKAKGDFRVKESLKKYSAKPNSKTLHARLDWLLPADALLIKSDVKEPVTCPVVFLTDRMMASLVHLTLHWQQCNWGNYSPLSPTCPVLCSGPSLLAFNEILTAVSCTHERTGGEVRAPLLPWSTLPHGWLKVSAWSRQLAYNTKYPLLCFSVLLHLWISSTGSVERYRRGLEAHRGDVKDVWNKKKCFYVTYVT